MWLAVAAPFTATAFRSGMASSRGSFQRTWNRSLAAGAPSVDQEGGSFATQERRFLGARSLYCISARAIWYAE